jgi:hypothetical protein
MGLLLDDLLSRVELGKLLEKPAWQPRHLAGLGMFLGLRGVGFQGTDSLGHLLCLLPGKLALHVIGGSVDSVLRLDCEFGCHGFTSFTMTLQMRPS